MLSIYNISDGAVVHTTPVGSFATVLTVEELVKFADEVNQAVVIARGTEKLSVRADCIEPGDIIMDMEVLLRHRVPSMGLATVPMIGFRFNAPYENISMTFPDHQIIDIERRIQ